MRELAGVSCMHAVNIRGESAGRMRFMRIWDMDGASSMVKVDLLFIYFYQVIFFLLLPHYCIFYRPITDLKWEKLEEVTTVEHIELNGLLSTEKVSSYVFKVKAVSKVGTGVESKENNPVQLLNVRLHVIECLFAELLSARQLIRYPASYLVLRLYVCICMYCMSAMLS